MSELNKDLEISNREKISLQDIELMIGETIPCLKKRPVEEFGVFIENGHVLELNLKNKKLTSLPKSFKNLSHLQTLDISQNLFRTIHEPLSKINSLKNLNLSECIFLSIFLLGQSLEKLNLRGCTSLGYIPGYHNSYKLTKFDLSEIELDQENLLKLNKYNKFIPLIFDHIELTPNKIYHMFQKDKISLEEAKNTLISIIDEHKWSYYVISSLNILQKLCNNQEQFINLLKNIISFDDRYIVLIDAIRMLLEYYNDDLKGFFKELIDKEKNVAVLSKLFNGFKGKNNYLFEHIKLMIIKSISEILEIKSDESLFFWDLIKIISENKLDFELSPNFLNFYKGLLEDIKYHETSCITTHDGNVIGLTLNNWTLNELPRSISQLKELKYLRIKAGKSFKLPDSIYQLTKIKHLDLEHHNLKQVPKGLFNFAQIYFSSKYEIMGIESQEATVLGLLGIFLSRHDLRIFKEGNIDPDYLEMGDAYFAYCVINDEGHVIKLVFDYKETSLFGGFIPEQIGLLTHLEELEISEDWISIIPESLFKLSRLRILKLAWNSIIELPENISKLKSLEYLDLRGFSLDTGEGRIKKIPESIGELKNLKYLNLKRNKIDKLPDSIGNLEKLEYLNIGKNRITELPESFIKCKSLRYLNFYRNKIKNIPREIGLLKHLEYLDANNNCLKSIPSTIGNLKNLKTLDISHNEIEKIPESIYNLIKLENLPINNNKIINISKQLGNLIFLKEISFQNNCIENIPISIANLKDLTNIDLTNNNLEEIPSEIGNIRRLNHLKLGNNKLKSIPINLKNIRINYKLELQNNLLQEIPDIFDQGNHDILRILNLEGNKLSKLPLSISNLKNLKKLILARNNFNDIPKVLNSILHIDVLDLSYNNIESIPLNIINLKVNTLNLAHNNIEVLPNNLLFNERLFALFLNNNKLKHFPIIFKGTSLYILDLSYNSLKEIPESLNDSGLKQCYYSFEGNQIEIIPKWLFSNQNISGVFLKDNKIRKFPDINTIPERLEYIDLSHNMICIVPENLGSSYAFKYLNLSHNRIKEFPPLPRLHIYGYLDLSHNEIEKIKPSKNFKVSYLVLESNKITDIDKDILKMDRVGYLNIKNNLLKNQTDFERAFSDRPISAHYASNPIVEFLNSIKKGLN
ncbi:MAG: leucine-rich repeat domain-containing protein [Promethearchaeota archaeon]